MRRDQGEIWDEEFCMLLGGFQKIMGSSPSEFGKQALPEEKEAQILTLHWLKQLGHGSFWKLRLETKLPEASSVTLVIVICE
jgi:hypothetical protein